MAMITCSTPNIISLTAPQLRARCVVPPSRVSSGGSVIECSSRPQKKGTKHHMKTRPRKTQPWDVRRKPTVYAPLPTLPPDFTLVSAGNGGGDVAPPPPPEAALAGSALQAPASSG